MSRYTTVFRLRQEGFLQAELSDAAAVLLIEEASDIISEALGQWFVPLRSQNKLDGMGSALLYLPSRVPILEVFSLGQISTAHAARPFNVPDKVTIMLSSNLEDMSIFDPSDYQLYGRYLELMYTEFWEGRGNVQLDCYSGWLDTFKSRVAPVKKASTGLTNQITNGAVDAIVDDISNFSRRDVVLFEKNDSTRELLGIAIVTGIEVGNKKLQFDALETKNASAIPAGSNVLTFGAVPKLIERATILLVKRLNVKINSSDYDDAAIAAKIKSEKTDRYSYTLFGDSDGGGIGLTGDALVDRQLSYYAEPQINVDFA